MPDIWIPPEEGWLKLNTDGARSLVDGSASYGGVLRDHNGKWIHGFNKFIGRCSVVEAELWGISTEMDLAWGLGCRQLIIESDSSEALRMVQQYTFGGDPYVIISYIRQICNKDWQIVFPRLLGLITK
ncbi:hypothetical protein V6N11_078252 [Hibiscus sabdariffa]|uniref:RNase H type-1 domain-containing protein n=1 Tax=Hibiscus sabdariffa TaxID=183260 RepID=A0ABR2TG59_9ROSI